jgi:hypothetical protein
MPTERAAAAAEHRDRITEAAVVIADWTRLWTRLLAVHVAGPDGRCRGCPSEPRVAPRWPCRLAELAGTARTIHLAPRVTR